MRWKGVIVFPIIAPNPFFTQLLFICTDVGVGDAVMSTVNATNKADVAILIETNQQLISLSSCVLEMSWHQKRTGFHVVDLFSATFSNLNTSINMFHQQHVPKERLAANQVLLAIKNQHITRHLREVCMYGQKSFGTSIKLLNNWPVGPTISMTY